MDVTIRNSMIRFLEFLRILSKAAFRLTFILVNNAYCIPTYVVWMVLLWPLRRINPEVYWRIEGYFFHWLLAMVSMWSWSAGYDIVELGDDITKCLDDRTLLIANHQSTADVPLLMSCFNARPNVLPNVMWIMDRLFKFTNFGIVSVIHQDFFILSGKASRDKSLQELAIHLLETFIPLQRKWMVLFPEGGFLRKRRVVSQRYAAKNGLPHLQHVTLPRVGAMGTILEVMGPQIRRKTRNNNSVQDVFEPVVLRDEDKLHWILDITIAYPEGRPLDLPTIIFGNRAPCKTLLFYRIYSCSEVPEDYEAMTSWLYARFEEKDRMLDSFYKTGKFPTAEYSRTPMPPHDVNQDCLRYIMLHLFFIASTYIHFQMFNAAYEYCKSLVVSMLMRRVKRYFFGHLFEIRNSIYIPNFRNLFT